MRDTSLEEVPDYEIPGSAKKDKTHAWVRKPKYVRPVHEIDPHDPELDEEEIFHD